MPATTMMRGWPCPADDDSNDSDDHKRRQTLLLAAGACAGKLTAATKRHSRASRAYLPLLPVQAGPLRLLRGPQRRKRAGCACGPVAAVAQAGPPAAMASAAVAAVPLLLPYRGGGGESPAMSRPGD
jgi:hypothetical protein